MIDGKFQGSEMSLGLFQDFMDGFIKFLRLPVLLPELWVPNQGGPIFRFSLWTCLKIYGYFLHFLDTNNHCYYFNNGKSVPYVKMQSSLVSRYL